MMDATLRAEEDARLASEMSEIAATNAQKTLLGATAWTLGTMGASYAVFSPMASYLNSIINSEGLQVLSVDQGQYFQDVVNAINILFSILMANTLVFLYQQNEAVFRALFSEVSVAKSLLEQIAFVSRGREAYALELLGHVERYVADDLRALDTVPVTLLLSRDDPLESVMWLTSVGAPGPVYETVKSLREARGVRLGALQRKLPSSHFALLVVLGIIDLAVFPLLAAATGAAAADPSLIKVQAVLFGFMASSVALILRLLYAFWIPTGDAYNVDAVLAVMVQGLEAEIQERKALALAAAPTSQRPFSPLTTRADTDALANIYNNDSLPPPKPEEEEESEESEESDDAAVTS
ncbi:hypothetical protein CTAYLR_001090 [Chrysophaeum taylorii]|uniref:Uncharacterized protein n=1 Tax=Chrysophaeum taylorii TaxID=2483200 RepID=A0AAD7XQP3_9STRA|nr:hypothetical protein CTAYLR_001090 [Chrysophaeum taylorii]